MPQNLAWHHADKIDAIAPNFATAGILSDGLAQALFLDPTPARLAGIGSDIKDPTATEVAYSELPTACFGELMNLIMGTSTMLKNIHCPTLVIQARDDHVVPAMTAMRIVQSISSDDVRLLWPNQSFHVATLDNDKDLIVDRVGPFFSEIAGS